MNTLQDVVQSHIQLFQRTKMIVRIFYFASLMHAYEAVLRYLDWRTITVVSENLLWPVKWVSYFSIEASLSFIVGGFILASIAVAIFYNNFLTRLVYFIFFFLFASFASSFGRIDHEFHLWLYISFIFIFLPGINFKRDNENMVTRQKFVFTFQMAQFTLLLIYSMSGFWKVYESILSTINGSVSYFTIDGLAYLVSNRLLATGETSFLAELILNSPVLSLVLQYSLLYVEIFAVAVFFRPRLHRLWGALIILFHVFTYFLLGISFLNHIILCLIFLVSSPSRKTYEFKIKEMFQELPGVGRLIRLCS